ncbi:DUF222 domain-containing protein [Jatrophihabitans sp. YIM 134969]
MHESAPILYEWVPCEPVFLETDDGFVLSDQAQAILTAMDDVEHGKREKSLSMLDQVAALRAQVDTLAALIPTAVREAEGHEVLGAIHELQAAMNVLASCDQALIAEIERRPDTIERTGARSTAAWLAGALRIRPAEAKRRVRTANGCAPRVTLTGEPLPPLRPHVAAAQTAGLITADHAHTIDRAVDALPVGLPVEVVDAAERELLDVARKYDPTDVATLGRDLRDTLDQDGPKPRDEAHRRRRSLRLHQNDDGAGVLRGNLTAGLFAKLQTVLSPLAAPRPDDGHGPDTRAADVRLHDALEELCDRFLRSGTLPDSGGVPTTLVVTMTVKDLETRTGRVHTSHGGDMSVAELLNLAAEAEIIPVVLNDAGGVLSHGRTKRLASAGQTKALIARDVHCSFPDCRIPPQWCQRHHVLDWLYDGETEIDNLTLLCGHHHRNFGRWGWTCHMQDGVPWWTPPPDVDPTRTPLRNATV